MSTLLFFPWATPPDMKQLALLLCILTMQGLSAQVPDDTLASWFRDGRYADITEAVDTLPVENVTYWAAYSCGLAHFVREEDSLSMWWLEQAIVKSPFQGGPYYYSGLLFQDAGRLTEAASRFRTASQLDPLNPDCWLSMAEVSMSLQQADSAFLYLSKAKELPLPPARVYLMIADIFLGEGAEKAALDEYYDCLYQAEVQSDGYKSCLYNIGYLEMKANRPEDAEVALSYLLSMDSDDFAALELLIQALVRLERSGPLNSYVQQMYTAYQSGLLPADMSDAFTLDVFQWKDHQVVVQERFVTADSMHVKYDFFMMDDSMQVNRHFVVAFHPSLASGNAYFIAEISGDMTNLYLDTTFRKTRVDYFQLRNEILAILKEERSITTVRPATLLGY